MRCAVLYTEPRRKMWALVHHTRMGNSNTTTAGNAVRKSVPWIALLVALAALGLGLWLLLRKPKAAMTSPSSSSGGTVARSVSSSGSGSGSGSISVFDLREMSYFPRGLVDPVRASVNRVLARVGDVTTKAYNVDKAKNDKQLKVALAKFEKQAERYTTVGELMF